MIPDAILCQKGLGNTMIKRHLVPHAPPPPRGVKYHHATEADGWLYVTGQLPTDPASPASALPSGVAAQAEQVFQNLKTIVEGVGLLRCRTRCLSVFTSPISSATSTPSTNVYHRYFPDDRAVPSRTTVGVAELGRDALVEVDLVLYRAPKA